jgi:glutathione S-transferase
MRVVTPGVWAANRDDPAFGGPYRGLPTLTCDGETIAEGLPIASFLARRLGHYEGLSDLAVARAEGICSAVYLDVMIRAAEIIWGDVLYPGVDLAVAAPRHARRMLGKLERLEATLPDGFLGGPRPVMADFFAAEGLETMIHVLDPSRAEALASRLPRLATLAGRIRERPAIARLHRPDRFTGRPDEAAVLERMRALPGMPP